MTRLYPIEIARILEQVRCQPSENLESETVEFKGYQNSNSLYNSKELAEELSAFANHCGGLVLIGVVDNSDIKNNEWERQLRGILDVDTDALRERLGGKLKPAIQLYVDKIKYEGHEYIAIQIDPAQDTLVSTASGKFYIREGRSSRPMQPYEIERKVKSLTKYDWSGDILPELEILDLDAGSLRAAIKDFQEKRSLFTAPTPEAYLESIGATSNGKLTRGGLLFMGRGDVINNYLGSFEFRFSWKRPNGNLEINEIWSGNLWKAIERAENHFDDCNLVESYGYRNTVFSVPLMDKIVFHEALLNAMVHRDYSFDGMTSITFTGKDLKIHSPGNFFGGVTAQNIGKHEPRHRNKNLANILMKHNLVDRAGMGVLRMGIGSLRYGRSFPEFREQSDAVEVKLEAKSLRPAVAALWIENQEIWGVPELLILNMVYEVGAIQVIDVESRLMNMSDSPLSTIREAIINMPQVEMCGRKEGVFVRVTPQWKAYLSVGRIFRVSLSSNKFVRLFEYLRVHGEASNSDLTDVFGHNHSSQTSKLLRDASFVERHGNGRSARWRLTRPYKNKAS